MVCASNLIMCLCMEPIIYAFDAIEYSMQERGGGEALVFTRNTSTLYNQLCCSALVIQASMWRQTWQYTNISHVVGYITLLTSHWILEFPYTGSWVICQQCSLCTLHLRQCTRRNNVILFKHTAGVDFSCRRDYENHHDHLWSLEYDQKEYIRTLYLL